MSFDDFTRSEFQLIRRKLSERLRKIRIDLFGAHGAPELARLIGVPMRTWISYEKGVTMPSEVVLLFLELTRCSPRWLLTGQGPTFQHEEFFADEVRGLGESFNLRDAKDLPEAIDRLELEDGGI